MVCCVPYPPQRHYDIEEQIELWRRFKPHAGQALIAYLARPGVLERIIDLVEQRFTTIGAADYGDATFHKALEELVGAGGDTDQELSDAAFYLFVAAVVHGFEARG